MQSTPLGMILTRPLSSQSLHSSGKKQTTNKYINNIISIMKIHKTVIEMKGPIYFRKSDQSWPGWSGNIWTKTWVTKGPSHTALEGRASPARGAVCMSTPSLVWAWHVWRTEIDVAERSKYGKIGFKVKQEERHKRPGHSSSKHWHYWVSAMWQALF